MNQKLLKTIGYIAFSIGLVIFGYFFVQTISGTGVDPDSNLAWMLEQAKAGKLSGPESLGFEKRISDIRQRKLIFSLAGFIACAAGLALIRVRDRLIT